MYQFHSFAAPGYMQYQADEEQLADVRREVTEIAQTQGQGWGRANSVLAGGIDRQYHLHHSRQSVYQLVLPMAQAYEQHFNYRPRIDRMGLTDPTQQLALGLGGLWVNYQQQGEHNPLHQHDGVYSFVIWLQVPYSLAEEQRGGPGQIPGTKSNGDFHFHYTDTLGAIRTQALNIDRSQEGVVCLFPSELSHIVYPFYTTSNLRISVSGNLHLAL